MRTLLVICGLIGLLFVAGFVGHTVGYYQGRSNVRLKASDRLASFVYRSAQEGKWDCLPQEVIESNVVDSLRETEKTEGPIRSWNIVGVTTTPLSLPVFVEVEVVRKKKQLERLVIHSGVHFSDYAFNVKSMTGYEGS